MMSRIISGKRAYRLYLTELLADLKDSQISCSDVCPSSGEVVQEIVNDPHAYMKTPIDLALPLRFDKLNEDTIPNSSYEIDLLMMSRAFLHVVNETVFYENFNHLTEKVFKPIVLNRPFVLTSTPGSLAYLRSYGFKTFSKWIDESYDQEPDHQKRLDMIAAEVQRIHSLSITELKQMYKEMRPVLDWNRELFFGDFENIILQELLQNYNTALNLEV